MDLEDSLAEYEELLKCAICLDVIREEKMLPCSHMFCLECLQGYCGGQRSVTCPECRKVHEIPRGGVKDFPKNIRLRQFLDKLCPSCSQNPKTERCPHCGEEVCRKCKELHVAKLREELAARMDIIEGVSEARFIKDAKREKKVLKDKEKLMEREVTRASEDIVKITQNRERKLKADLKKAFKSENEKLDTQLKSLQQNVSVLKSFGRKQDLPKMSIDKMKGMLEEWPRFEAMLPALQIGLNVKSSGIQHENGHSEIGIAMKRNWNILTDEDTSESSSVISDLEPPSPIVRKSSTVQVPSCIIGMKGLSPGRLDSPFRTCCSSTPLTKNLVTVDTKNNRVQTFSMSGDYLTSFGFKGNGNNEFNHPIGIIIDKDGYHYIADTQNHRIEVIDSRGIYSRSFGKEGRGISEFSQPWDITMDSNKLVYITDCLNNRVQVMGTDGRYVRTIGENKLSNPTGIVVDKNGDVIVADCENHRIVVFSKFGQLKQSIGKEGQKSGELSYPDGLVLDADGNIVVAEWGNHRIQVFSRAGKSLRVIGSHGSGPGEFQHPRGVTIVDGRMVVSDCGNNRLQVF